jgi:hypothetical protein
VGDAERVAEDGVEDDRREHGVDDIAARQRRAERIAGPVGV